MNLATWTELLVVAGAAGFVDAIMGGGGMLQVPALFIALPGASPATLLGTNKVVSAVGTAGAAVQYALARRPSWRVVLPMALAACVCAGMGALLVSQVPPLWLRRALPVILTVLWAYTALSDHGLTERPAPCTARQVPFRAGLTGAAVGFYDGLFGPGAGAFYKLMLARLLGLDFLGTAASAKFANLASNLGALLVFAAQVSLYWQLAAGMAIANFLGGQLGARFALKRGNMLMRKAFLGLVLVLAIRSFLDVVS
jgi:uncharacterized membrane protein YfcA